MPNSQVRASNEQRASSLTRYEALRVTPPPLLLQRRAPRVLRRHVWRGLLRVAVLVAADVALLLLLRALLHAVRENHVLGGGPSRLAAELVPPGTYPAAQLLTAVLVGLLCLGNYGAGDYRRHARRLAAGVLLGLALNFWSELWASFAPITVVGFLCVAFVASAAFAAERLLIDAVVRLVRSSSGRLARTLVVGPAEAARRVLQRPEFHGGGDFNFVGFVDTSSAAGSDDSLGGLETLSIRLEEHHVDTVILSGPMDDIAFGEVTDAATASGCHVFSLPRNLDGRHFKPELVWRSGVPMVQLTRPGLRGQQLAVKRAVDFVGALAGLIAFAPLYAAIALAVKLDSPGPVLFTQLRAGLGGRCFRMLKFRTMRIGADAEKQLIAHLNQSGDGRLFKIPDDPRVTRVGALLRRWSLDELPQLVNVLRGDMSLVGPRPFFESDFQAYEQHHFRRLGARPGITGLWQVKGRSAITDFEEVVRLDREYIQRWSVWLDLWIIGRTVPAVLRRTGAF